MVMQVTITRITQELFNSLLARDINPTCLYVDTISYRT
jgi:hypothetical protein